MNEKEVCGGKGEKPFHSPRRVPCLQLQTAGSKSAELNFCPLQRREKARAGEESIYLSVCWDENGVVRDVKLAT